MVTQANHQCPHLIMHSLSVDQVTIRLVVGELKSYQSSLTNRLLHPWGSFHLTHSNLLSTTLSSFGHLLPEMVVSISL